MRGKAVKVAVLCAALALFACSSTQRPGTAPAPRPFTHLQDLTHTLDSAFPFIPVPGVTYPFSISPIATIDAAGVAANEWKIHEHLGTQIDSPNHFVQGGRSLEEMRNDELIVPMVVIDISARAARDPDAELTVADIEAWERVHGRIAGGACVMMFSGWEKFVGDAARYIGADAAHVKHFPGISLDAARFLVERRRIWGVGVDTISIDPGHDNEYRTHKLLLGADKLALEAVANLASVPPVGALLFVGASKVRGATGGPVRLVAVW